LVKVFGQIFLSAHLKIWDSCICHTCTNPRERSQLLILLHTVEQFTVVKGESGTAAREDGTESGMIRKLNIIGKMILMAEGCRSNLVQILYTKLLYMQIIIILDMRQ